jgi:hypothetical protein
MSAATVNMNTYSDADFVKAFMLRVTDDSGAGASYYYDFAGVAMQIMTRADGIADDIWRGTLTHAIGPTR